MPKKYTVQRSMAADALMTLKHPAAHEALKAEARRALKAWVDDPQTLGHPLTRAAREALAR